MKAKAHGEREVRREREPEQDRQGPPGRRAVSGARRPWMRASSRVAPDVARGLGAEPEHEPRQEAGERVERDVGPAATLDATRI